MNKINKVLLLASILILFIATSQLYAFQFEPLTHYFTVSGSQSAKTYTITNDSDETIAIELKALVRDQDENGVEINADASQYFTIQPAKVIVKPQSTYIVRVQYRGPKTLSKELSFRIKAEQIPYSQGRTATNTSMFTFLYVYNSSAYVVPQKINEKVTVSDVQKSDNGLDITLANSGSVHQLLDELTITVTDKKGNKAVLDNNDTLPGIYGINILAGKTWTKSVPFPENLDPNSTYKATISYNFKYQAE